MRGAAAAVSRCKPPRPSRSRTAGCGTRCLTLPAMRAKLVTPPPALPGPGGRLGKATVPDHTPDMPKVGHEPTGGGRRRLRGGCGSRCVPTSPRCGNAVASAAVSPANLGTRHRVWWFGGACGRAREPGRRYCRHPSLTLEACEAAYRVRGGGRAAGIPAALACGRCGLEGGSRAEGIPAAFAWLPGVGAWRALWCAALGERIVCKRMARIVLRAWRVAHGFVCG